MATLQTGTVKETTAPRLFTRAEALGILKIGETTLFWLQRTGKLKPIRIGSRVLFAASEIQRIATHGASLSQSEKEAAEATRVPVAPALRGRGRVRRVTP